MASSIKSNQLPNLFFQEKFCLKNSTEQKHTQFKRSHKTIVIILFVGLFFAYRYFFHQVSVKNCVVDNIHEWTFSLNRWINKHAAKAFIGFGQIMMDINISFMTIYWMIFVKNFRYAIVTALFQYGRQFMLKIITMPFESYVVWQNPGFHSFTVFYEHTSDYYFSGHTGTLVILYLECKRLNFPKWIQWYCLFALFYMIFMLLVARVHYTIDIFGGFLHAVVFYRLVQKNLSFFDHIMNAPYKLADVVKEKVKKKLEEKQDQGTSVYDIQHF